MILSGLVAGLVCFAVAGGLCWRLRGSRRQKYRWTVCVTGGVLCFQLSVFALVAAAGWVWYFHRPQPSKAERHLFRGVSYERRVQRTPWPMVSHVVRVDLDSAGLGFMVRPADPSGGRAYRAIQTTSFLKQVQGQVAINASRYAPYHNNGPLDYYPHSGDPVDVTGYCASGGVQIGAWRAGQRAIVFDAAGRVTMTDSRVTTGFNAVSGYAIRLDVPAQAAHLGDREPRTAVALDASGRVLLLIVVDGRQPNYSEGATLGELGVLIRRAGGALAINLDGGGSSVMAYAPRPGKAKLLNTPCNSLVPGWERPVANQIVVFAAPLE